MTGDDNAPGRIAGRYCSAECEVKDSHVRADVRIGRTEEVPDEENDDAPGGSRDYYGP